MAEPDRARVCVLGSINLDLVVRTPRLPAPGETILGGPCSRSPGGKGANQAVAAARMGAAVSVIGAVGGDEYGREMLEVLAADGVDTSRIVTRGSTGTAFITVAEGGENSIIVAPGANSSLTAADIDAARGLIADADVLLMQLETPLEAAAHAAKLAGDLGATVILNAAPAQKLPASILALLDVLIVNEIEADSIGGPLGGSADESTLDRLARLGVSTVIMTVGDRGAHWCHLREHRGLVPACPVRPVDTVGAGDAFCGALAARLAEHKIGGGIDRDGVFDSVCWANAAGALATLKQGAIPSLPTRAEIVAMLRQVSMEAPA